MNFAKLRTQCLFSMVISHKVQNTYEKCLCIYHTTGNSLANFVKLFKNGKHPSTFNYSCFSLRHNNSDIGERMMEIPSSGQF